MRRNIIVGYINIFLPLSRLISDRSPLIKYEVRISHSCTQYVTIIIKLVLDSESVCHSSDGNYFWRGNCRLCERLRRRNVVLKTRLYGLAKSTKNIIEYMPRYQARNLHRFETR